MNISKYTVHYKDALLNNVIPFWEKHSPDKEHGGYITCLDREGKVYDTDKFIWLQCRQIWLFSMLYNKVEQKQEWLDIALLGADFLEKNGMDKGGNWYFSLTKEGNPLVQPYNIFSDCFAALCLIATIFFYKYVPETKGKSLEEIESHWDNGRRSNIN